MDSSIPSSESQLSEVPVDQGAVSVLEKSRKPKHWFLITIIVLLILLILGFSGWFAYTFFTKGKKIAQCQLVYPLVRVTHYKQQSYNETCREVWLKTQVPLKEKTNMLAFDLEFTSKPGAHGIFTISFDNQKIGTIDEATVKSGKQTYTYHMPEKQPGTYELALRMVPQTWVKSSISLTNVGTAYDRLYIEPMGQLPANSVVIAKLDTAQENFLISPNKTEAIIVSNYGQTYAPSKCSLCSKYENVSFAGYTGKGEGQKLFFIGVKNGKSHFVFQGKEDAGYDSIQSDHVAFDNATSHYAYLAELGTMRVAVKDGVEIGRYDNADHNASLGDLILSPDGSRVAFSVTKYTDPYTSFTVIDGKEQLVHESIKQIIFSPDNQHVAYVAEDGVAQTMTLYVDGKQEPMPAPINDLPEYDSYIFSPDSGHVMRINYLDPNAGKTVTNGASVANVVEQGDSQEAVSVNGAIGKTYKGVVNIQFSPDGKRVAYNAITQDNKPVVVLDGKELQGYSPLRPFAFSPDSQHFAYWSGPTMSKYPWQQIGDDTPSFLGKSYVVVDDKKGELFDDMHDGNYEAFSYMPGNPLMPMQNTIEFTSDGKYVRYNERKGDSILLITQPVDGVI